MVARMFGALGVMCVVVAAVLATSCDAVRPPAASGTSVVGVLVSGATSSVCVYDLADGRSLGAFRLRSPAYDIAADTRTGCFVTAQSGGVGADSDRRLGIIAPHRTRRVAYVDLPWPNPWLVAASDANAYVVHGVVGDGGLRLSRVDLRTRSLKGAGRVPDGTSDIVPAGGRLLVPHIEPPAATASSASTGPASWLGQLDPGTLSLARVAGGMVHGGGVVVRDPLAGADADTVLVAGSREAGARADSAVVLRVDLVAGRVVQAADLDSLQLGVGAAVAAGNQVAVLDADESGRSEGGQGVVVLDAESLRLVGRIALRGGCAAIGSSENSLIVADEGSHSVSAHEAGSLKRLWRAHLGGDPVALSVAVLEP